MATRLKPREPGTDPASLYLPPSINPSATQA
jgi:hypothetical protein